MRVDPAAHRHRRMIGLILLAATWILLRLEGKGLAAIGVDQPPRRVMEFLVGVALMGTAALVQQLASAIVMDDALVPNPRLTSSVLGEGVRLLLNSLLYEELAFRGYLLFQAVRWLGPTRAAWLDAIAFGIYHWFSYGVIGNPVVMLYVLVMTGAFGFMLARAFVATGSISAPLGLHLGWNAVVQLLFSAGPPGAMVLVPASGAAKINLAGVWSVVLSIIWPLLTIGLVVALCRWYGRHHAARTRPASPLSATA